MENKVIDIYKDEEPATAALLAWINPGRNPGHHVKMKNQVRREMPLLGRALDRLAYEHRKATNNG